MSQCDKDTLTFVIWLINQVARAWGKTTPEVYRTLQQADIVNDYILPFYEQLHTMGSQALVDDITILARKRGLAV